MNRTVAITAFFALAALTGLAALLATSPTNAQSLKQKNTSMQTQIQRLGSQASVEGPKHWFTGSVRIDPLFSAKDPSKVGSASVTFEPGARTAWHTHPLGQHLVITSGLGWVQEDGHDIHEVRPGDVVWFPPGVKHWHGASPTNAMTHIAIQEAQDGEAVHWHEHVSDEQYQK